MHTNPLIPANRKRHVWNPDWIGPPTTPAERDRIASVSRWKHMEIMRMGEHEWLTASEGSFRAYLGPLWYRDQVRSICTNYGGAERQLQHIRDLSLLGAAPVGDDSPYAGVFQQALSDPLPDSIAELRACREELAGRLVHLDTSLRSIVDDFIAMVAAILLFHQPSLVEVQTDYPHPLASHLDLWRRMGLGRTSPFAEVLGQYVERVPDPAAQRGFLKGISAAHHRLRTHNEMFEVPRKVGRYVAIERKLEVVSSGVFAEKPRANEGGPALMKEETEILEALGDPRRLVEIIMPYGESWKERQIRLEELCSRAHRKPPYRNWESMKSALSRAQREKRTARQRRG